jgi:hypothetical protein
MSSGFPERVETLVVCPSISFPSVELRKITGIEHYEERMLYLVLALRDPGVRVVYLTSMPVDPDIVDYYLSFVDAQGAGARLHLLSVGNPEPRALTAKLLERPELVDRVRDLVDDPARAYVLPFNVTSWEVSLADALGLPLYGPPLEAVPLGSKSGGRRVARAAGVDVLEGAEDLWSEAEVDRAIADLRRRRPGLRAAVIKLNNGFSGQGNAILEAASLRTPLRDSPTVFCASEESWASFAGKIEAEGAVVEELVRGRGVSSPSAQVRIEPGGRFSIVSTHDQILGGPDDQVYLGCRFPARPGYRRLISEGARGIARELARRGVVGPFGVDFLVVPAAGGRRVYLTEINLRVGGTTHPFEMARLATGGRYDEATGVLGAGGRAKHYVTTDNLRSQSYVGLAPGAVVRALGDSGLAFDVNTGTGVTVHLLGALASYGKMGVSCIGNSYEEAEDIYRFALECVEGVAASARAG